MKKLNVNNQLEEIENIKAGWIEHLFCTMSQCCECGKDFSCIDDEVRRCFKNGRFEDICGTCMEKAAQPFVT